jgi:hypothetical protein
MSRSTWHDRTKPERYLARSVPAVSQPADLHTFQRLADQLMEMQVESPSGRDTSEKSDVLVSRPRRTVGIGTERPEA